ncbi:MAG: NAD(P)/FAD-dependent oxidoreductase [Trinickia sp.]|jgi:glycine/D-amino acid oxidase-like deaminating enzyme
MTGWPTYATGSGWNAIARNRVLAPRASWDGLQQADHVVVGAGLAGLSVARSLAERFPNRRIVLLDADQPGATGSGRNSGFLIDLPYAKISAGEAARQSWQTRLLGYGRRTLKNLVDEHHIECDWRDAGHYKAATTAGGYMKLEALSRTLNANGIEHRALSKDEIAAELGTSHYQGAFWLSHCALIQPAELVHGLIASLPRNVEVCFETPVTKLRRNGSWSIETGAGKIRSPSVVLCVNTALPRFGYAKYRQLTAYTYAALTRPLPDAQFAQLGTPDEWGVTPVERLEATSRKVRGNRLLFRQGFSYQAETSPRDVRRMLEAGARVRYPFLGDDPFEYVWGGAVSLTRNEAPVFGRHDEGLYALSGCNASGILKMTALGQLLVDLMTGTHSPLLSETLRFCDPTFIPPEPIRRIAVNINLKRFARELTSGARS